MHDIARLSASYDTYTEADCVKMDTTGKGVCASYGAKYLGGSTDFNAKRRVLEWQMSERQALRAESDLQAFGFGTAIVVIA